MSGKVSCLEPLDSSWIFGFAAWMALAAGLVASLLGFASLEARKVKNKKYSEAVSDIVEDDETSGEELYLSDIYETMPEEYKIKDIKKMKRENQECYSHQFIP